MYRELLKFIHAVYVNTRRLSHSLITQYPLLDKVIGNPLRHFTRHWEWELASRALSNPVTIGEHQLFHRPEDAYIISRLCLDTYEPEVNQQVVKLLEPGMTVVDIGANLGWYTLLAAKLVGPSGCVYAFEASPLTAEVLKKNVFINGYNNIKVMAKGVAESKGKIPFFIEHSSGASSLFSSGHEIDSIEVQVIGLDEFFQEEGWPPVHLKKLDIEGAEKLALAGMQELSRRNSKLKAIVEINLKACSLEELLGILQSCGFSRFFALEIERDLSIPQDIPLIYEAIHRLTVNLLCEK